MTEHDNHQNTTNNLNEKKLKEFRSEERIITANGAECEHPLAAIPAPNKSLIVNELITISKNTKNTISIAKRRWKILAKALCNRANRSKETAAATAVTKSTPIERLAADEYLASVRRFTSFDLFERIPCTAAAADNNDGRVQLNDGNWIVYRLRNKANVEYKAMVHYVNKTFTPNDLMGFNNTGNICVWPSEEALAYYCVAKMDFFRGKRMLELGGGMTCLAGLLVAKYAAADCVHLTDGNCVSVENVRNTLSWNGLGDNVNVRSSILKWEHALSDSNNNCEPYDCILSADCLFFDNARSALVDALWHFLASDGCAIVMAPYRGQTLDSFVKEAIVKGFMCRIDECYDDLVWRKHLQCKEMSFYNENIHYPLLIELTKPSQ